MPHRPLILATLASALVLIVPMPVGLAQSGAVARGTVAKNQALAPHRAVYEMTLDERKAGGSVTDVTGRMVFEITGSVCEGYTQNMRFVMQTTNRDGQANISDMRSSSWEDGAGGKYRFTTSNYRDQEQTEATTGTAERARGPDGVKVELTKPAKSELKIGADVLFPVQHSKRLIEVAVAGQRALEADVYDGSDKGEKVYSTVAIIGRAITAKPAGVIDKVANAERLDAMVSWPVTISYYDSAKGKEDALPVYEIGFRYYLNGVSESLTIDYGDFALKGALRQIDFYDASKCDK